MSHNRRTFIKRSAVATAAASLGVHSSTPAAEGNDDIRVGVVGINGRGRSHISAFGSRVAALCDCDATVLDRERKKLPAARTYVDFRELLDDQSIDIISIATPNHHHSLMGIWAAQAGKDVYVEKPVSHSVWEGRQLVHAARNFGRMIQCGTQSRSSQSLHEAVAFVHSGKLGAIQYAVGTCYKPRGSIGKLDKPLQIPASIDYDAWCGPADKVDLYRPKLHYDWHWDFNTGNGDMGNQGIHQMDIARWFLGEEKLSPRILSIGGRLGYDDAGNTPNTQVVLHDYPTAPLIFETRGLRSSKDSKDMDRYRGSRIGVIVQCEQGHVVIPNYTSATAYDSDGEVIQTWTAKGDSTKRHADNFLAAVKSRNWADLNADVLDGHISSALCHTGNVSHRVGNQETAEEIRNQINSNSLLSDSFERMAQHLDANEIDINKNVVTLGPVLEMDPDTEQITNHAEGNRLLRRDGRGVYIIPDLS